MVYWLTWLAAGMIAIALAVLVGLWLMRRLRKSTRSGLVVASALLMSFGLGFNNRDHTLIEECRNDARRKRDAQSGDPPEA